MKDRKRIILYSLLALPILILVVFMATVDPIARKNFFSDFGAGISQQFGGKSEVITPVPAGSSGPSSGAGTSASESSTSDASSGGESEDGGGEGDAE